MLCHHVSGSDAHYIISRSLPLGINVVVLGTESATFYLNISGNETLWEADFNFCGSDRKGPMKGDCIPVQKVVVLVLKNGSGHTIPELIDVPSACF